MLLLSSRTSLPHCCLTRQLRFLTVLWLLLHVMQMARVATVTAGKTWSVAPMMKHTNIYLRALCRIISPKSAQLFTEMVTCDEILLQATTSSLDKMLSYSPHESIDSLILQLGGRDPKQLAAACTLASQHSTPYRRFNLNVGCPSNTIAGVNQFGAALMLEPFLVAECCQSMKQTCQQAEVSVKCRIGLDDRDAYEDLHRFIEKVSTQGGVHYFQIHARKAILGINPMANRQAPPLRYDFVHQIAKDFPHLRIELNGGLTSPDACLAQLNACTELSGVMVGRAVINHPYAWSVMDVLLAKHASGVQSQPQPQPQQRTRGDILEEYISFLESLHLSEKQAGIRSQKLPPSSVQQRLSPVFNLFAGEVGSERFQRKMAVMCKKGVSNAQLILSESSKEISEDVLKSTTFRDLMDVAGDQPWLEKKKKTNAPMRSGIQ